MGITPEFAREITERGFEVVTMGHAYRVNGVVDIWFNGRTLFDINKNDYKNYDNRERLVTEAIKIASSQPKKAPFKPVKSGRLSYQGFRHKEHKPVAEYYHWQNDKKTSEDHLYFMKCGEAVKIGRSLDPNKRILGLKTGNPEEIEILFVAQNKGHMESTLHRCFSDWKVRENSEWFSYSKQIQDFIEYIKK